MPKLKSNTKNIDDKTKVSKHRNWAFVAYPESVPNNWLEILRLSGLKVAISPLHDKDLNADEAEKKPHWHIILVWNGPASYTVAEKITKSINGTIPMALNQIRGYYRYFTHKDNPEKYQYDEKEIKTLNGFNIADFTEMTRSETDEIIKQIIKLIVEKDIIEYNRLLIYLINDELHQEFSVARSNTLLFNSFICSRRNELTYAEKIMRYIKDPENGNIINTKTGQVVGKEE